MKWYEIIGLIGSAVSIGSAVFAFIQAKKAKTEKKEAAKMKDEIYGKFNSFNDLQLMNEINLTIKSITDRSFGKNKTTSSLGKSGFTDVLQY